MVVFFDIDGTLVDEATQIIPSSAVDAIEALLKNGHLPVINTGRPYSHIAPRIRALPFAGWVCGAGMEILLDGRWLLRRDTDPHLCRQVIDQARACHMQVLYEAEGGYYLDGDLSIAPSILQEVSRMAEREDFFVRQLSQAEAPHFIKLISFDAATCRRAEFLEFMQQHFTCIDRGNTMVEFVAKGCSKADGMALLLENLGISRQDTYALGDSTNDLPMFHAAGHAICMAGGMQQAKDAAEFVTDTVLGDGVAKALRHYGLI